METACNEGRDLFAVFSHGPYCICDHGVITALRDIVKFYRLVHIAKNYVKIVYVFKWELVFQVVFLDKFVKDYSIKVSLFAYDKIVITVSKRDFKELL